MVKVLLAHGANPNFRLTNGTPIRRTDPDPLLPGEWVGGTPFFLAAKFLETDIMRVLVAGGADPLITIQDQTTPLMAAAGVGWVTGFDRRGIYLIPAPAVDESKALESVKLTIELGADVTAVNQAGDTAGNH